MLRSSRPSPGLSPVAVEVLALIRGGTTATGAIAVVGHPRAAVQLEY